MRESVTYQAILAEGREEGREVGRAEGRVEGARETVLRLGRKRYGEPTREVAQALEALTSAEALEALAERILEAENWDELLA